MGEIKKNDVNIKQSPLWFFKVVLCKKLQKKSVHLLINHLYTVFYKHFKCHSINKYLFYRLHLLLDFYYIFSIPDLLILFSKTAFFHVGVSRRLKQTVILCIQVRFFINFNRHSLLEVYYR